MFSKASTPWDMPLHLIVDFDQRHVFQGFQRLDLPLQLIVDFDHRHVSQGFQPLGHASTIVRTFRFIFPSPPV